MKHIWIIDKSSSVALFYYSYSELGIDPIIVSALLTTFNNFSEVELQAPGVSFVEMGGFRWVYLNMTEQWNLLLIAAGDKDANPEVMRSKLDIIFNAFTEQFHLTPEAIKKGIQNVSIFDPFKKTLDELNDHWNQAGMSFESAMIFDMLGIFQQLLNEIHPIFQKEVPLENRSAVLEEITRFWNNLKTTGNLAENPEYMKMQFDSTDGWDILRLRPHLLEIDEVKTILMNIVHKLRDILVKHLKDRTPTVFAREIMPYLLSEYTLLEQLKINQRLLNLFAVYPSELQKG